MTDSLIILLTDIFFGLTKHGKDGFMIIKFTVPLKVLSELYERLCKADVPPIETIPAEEKERYWSMAKTYYQTEEDAIKASKAAYILSLITSS